MHRAGTITDDELFLVEQETLATALERLGKDLRRRRMADPRLTTEVVLTALATIRTWVGTAVVLTAVEEAGRDSLEEWEWELGEDAAHLAALRAVLNEELHMSLRERNRRRSDLAARWQVSHGPRAVPRHPTALRHHSGS